MFLITRAYRIITIFLSASYNFILEFRGVCKLHVSNCSAAGAFACAEQWELDLNRVYRPGLRKAVSPSLMFYPRAYVRQTGSVEDPPPVLHGDQFAGVYTSDFYVERDYYQRRQKSNAYSVD